MSQSGKLNPSSTPIPPSVATSYVLDVGTAVPSGNVLEVHGGIGVTTSLGASNEIIITVKTDGMTWTDEATNFNAVSQNGYFCTASLTATLPSAPAQGTTVYIFADTSSAVTVQAQGSDMIQVSSNISAAGGTAVSNTRGSTLELAYRTADATWHTISSMGTWAVT